jgi:putative membrane protein
MKSGVILAALAGLAGAAYLIFAIGFDAVWAAVTSVGWRGFGLLLLYGVANFALLGMAWFALVPPWHGRQALTFAWGRAIRDSAGDVLPFSQLGGMVIGARAVMLRGESAATAFGSTVVDITLEMIAQIGFILMGIAILFLRTPIVVDHMDLASAAVGGVLVAMLGAGGFVVAQRKGFSWLEKIAERFLPKAAAHAANVDREINDIHAHPKRMVLAFLVHFIGWLNSAFGTWLALELIGAHTAFTSAIAIESLLCAARSAAIFVPGAIGIQEAGYALMMPLFGLPADVGIAVSLLKRAREIATGAPVLLTWQLAEGGHAARKDLQESK